MPCNSSNRSDASTTRREWFRRLAASCAAAGILQDGLVGPLADPHKPLHVIIVGAGMAGLCAAYEIELMGHAVTLLEADTSHAGGRVRTMRFANGQYGELGAMRIPRNHHITRSYATKFGLKLRPFIEYNPNAYYFAHGVRKRNRDVSHMSRAVTLGMDGRAPSEWSQSFDEIEGGMDKLASAFVSRLKSPPRFGCVLHRIEQDSTRKRVAAIYDPAGQPSRAVSRVEGDYLICTLPIPVLRKIQFEPALPASRLRAMEAMPYVAANKVLFATSSRFWEIDDRIFGGGTYTDLPTELTYYPSDNAGDKDPKVSRGPGVLLASYSLAKPALHFAGESRNRATAEARSLLTRIHPQLARPGMVTEMAAWSWDHHPWSLGGFAAPHKHMELNAALAAPEGRVLFAGEHLSQRRTWIQGAFESALAAVRHILQAG